MSIRFAANPTAGHGAADAGFFFDPERFTRVLAKLERVGFSAVVVDDVAGLLANLDISAAVGASTSSLTIAATHWAGFVQPTIAARQLAYLDRLTGGRLSLRLVADPDGNLNEMSHERLSRRMGEYASLLKRLWANEKPIDHEGEFFSLRGAFVPEKGPQRLGISIRMGGLSGTAIRLAAQHATVFELPFSALPETVALIGRVQSAVQTFGRSRLLSYSLSVPADLIVETARHDGVDAVRRLLAPYAHAGISEFILTGAAVAGLASLPWDEIGNGLAHDERPAPVSKRQAENRLGGFGPN